MKNAMVSILPRLASAAVMTLSGALAAGQSYGTNDQVLTIGGGPLRDLQEHPGKLQSDGYAYTQGGVDTFLTPLPLPEGAELRMLCLYANDHSPGESVSASVVMVKLVPGGGGGGQIATVPNSLVASTADIGYGYYCTGDIGYTLTDVTDVDGDGVPDAVVYYVKVVAGGVDAVGVGAIRVTWRRKVSSPPDVPTFADVPASDPAFSHIEALAASGITSGCGNGDFCPGAHLTRRQMAVFLAKALGLHWGSP
jgi:hypothetical protein